MGWVGDEVGEAEVVEEVVGSEVGKGELVEVEVLESGLGFSEITLSTAALNFFSCLLLNFTEGFPMVGAGAVPDEEVTGVAGVVRAFAIAARRSLPGPPRCFPVVRGGAAISSSSLSELSGTKL